ncbi:MAG: hypothetical protein HGA49_10260 [Eubacteriaceae bacterium]|nr:hypothetical protein [Eubacteriaceae bacterium]
MIIIFFIINFGFLRSIVVMRVSSFINKTDKAFSDFGIEIALPGGLVTPEKDWYPFVNYFNDTGISRFLGEEANMTVIYNFGTFENGRSTLYEKNSKYFNSFYGCYIIKGVKDNRLLEAGDEYDFDRISKIPEYDMEELVLKSMGCENPAMREVLVSLQEDVTYAGYSDWTKVDSLITVNSVAHSYQGFKLSYLQYGTPENKPMVNDFYLIDLKARMYIRYFQDKELYVLFFIISPDQETLEKTDHIILAKTIIQ